MSEEAEEVQQKPESMMPKNIQAVLEETLNTRLEEAIKTGDMNQAADLQRAKKLIHRGCWSVRKANPYTDFMGECLLDKGGSLKDTQDAMKECAEKWHGLPKEKKKATGEEVFDYL